MLKARRIRNRASRSPKKALKALKDLIKALKASKDLNLFDFRRFLWFSLLNQSVGASKACLFYANRFHL